MDSNFLVMRQLLAMGWTERMVKAALDEPDEVGPAGHWLNTSGKPYYHPGRVAVAAYRVGLADHKPDLSTWNTWVSGAKPTGLPIVTFDFHRIAGACKPGARGHLDGLRICHPYWGRQRGTETREAIFIIKVLMLLIRKTHGIEMAVRHDLDVFFEDTADKAVSELGEPWPKGVVARKAHYANYVSKAVSLSAMRKFVNALALIHTGRMRLPDEEASDVVRWLIRAPRMRFDLAASQLTQNTVTADSQTLH